MTFYDLAIGQRFEFVDANDKPAVRWGSIGPWFKLGAGKYAYRADVNVRGGNTTSQNARVRAMEEETDK